ncbi:Rieske (2Fe-2S) protein [Kocuria sp. CPCC 205292]|uniref:Rieske (2Fe-2S) protein n=1 Tax=Kocuria cellulosilytica TaxID=3071451 RepID=UPI0034D5D05E
MAELPPPPSAPSRRAVLGLAGSGALLAGCAGQDPPAGGGTGGTGGAAPVDAGPVEDLPVGSAVKVDRDGVQAVVSRPGPDRVVAFSPVCPHQGCMVTPREELYVCPCHSSQFDLTTGEVLAGPAETGLEPYPASVEGGRILLG